VLSVEGEEAVEPLGGMRRSRMKKGKGRETLAARMTDAFMIAF
jgi:hypothetical protein